MDKREQGSTTSDKNWPEGARFQYGDPVHVDPAFEGGAGFSGYVVGVYTPLHKRFKGWVIQHDRDNHVHVEPDKRVKPGLSSMVAQVQDLGTCPTCAPLVSVAGEQLRCDPATAWAIRDLTNAIVDIRREALEDAAKLAEQWNGSTCDGVTTYIAEAIRKLSQKEAGK